MSLSRRRSTLACLFAVGLSPAPLLSLSCAHLTPLEGSLLQGADVLACSALTLIPTAGAAIAAFCPGEEAWVRDAIAHAEATDPAPDAGAGTDSGSEAGGGAGDAGAGAVPSGPLTSARTLALAVAPGGAIRLGAPLYRGMGAGRRMIGRCPCGWAPAKVAVAQAHIDAAGQDGGR